MFKPVRNAYQDLIITAEPQTTVTCSEYSKQYNAVKDRRFRVVAFGQE